MASLQLQLQLQAHASGESVLRKNTLRDHGRGRQITLSREFFAFKVSLPLLAKWLHPFGRIFMICPIEAGQRCRLSEPDERPVSPKACFGQSRKMKHCGPGSPATSRDSLMSFE